MNRNGFRPGHTLLLAACLLLPTAARANPVMLNPSSLMALCIVAFWAFAVEAGVVAFLLGLRGVAPFRAFIAYFAASGAIFFSLFQPLITGNRNLPVLALEGLVVLLDGLAIKLMVTLDLFQGDNYRNVTWLRSLVISGIGNVFSYFIGHLANHRPWEGY